MNNHSSMNRIYRLVWSERLKSYIAVAEIARGKGKSVLRGFARGVIAAAMAAGLAAGNIAFAAPPAPNALPTGGQVAQGQASINTNGNNMDVSQSGQKAVINWQTFNIGQNAGVNFNQPNSSAIALNRVLSADPSAIYGRLTANGQVFLLNPSGIVFGPTASVNAGGIVASTLSLNDKDFMNGNYRFYNAGGAGSINNQGSITAGKGGYIALLAPQVINEGIIFAKMGTVAMAAGDQVTLDFNGDGLINFTVDEGAVNALIDNKNLVQADGGLVIMNAKAANSLTSAVVNNEGIIQAQTIENVKGVIKLLGDMQNGAVNVGGTLDASAPNGGDGGFVETSAGRVHIADTTRVTTRAPYGKIGMWLLDPTNYTIAASGGDETGQQVSDSLSLTGRTILADENIYVNDNVSWSAHLLTLQTTSGDVNINAVMTASGTASLDLEPGSGKVNVGFNPDGTFKGRVDFPVDASDLTQGYRSGPGFLTINGHGYTVINSVGNAGDENSGADTLQGMGYGNNLGGYYALGSNIDASPTYGTNGADGWNAGSGFSPVGDNVNNFTGIFDGLGHTIDGLYVNRSVTDNVGLFGYISGATIRNVGLTGVKITGQNYVGSLVGYNNGGTISNSYATISGSVYGYGNRVGGLVGANYGTIDNSYAIINSGGSVSGTGDNVGGLVGYNDSNGTIQNGSYASISGSVYGNSGGGKYGIGGLVGANYGAIDNSYAIISGTVGGAKNIGGLVGANYGAINNSYATINSTINSNGNVTGTGDNVGGLVGKNDGRYGTASIDNSYAIINSGGSVRGSNYVGGLVGYGYGSNSTISNSYTTISGTVSSTGYYGVGGLVGGNRGIVSGSHAAINSGGTVENTDYGNVGGLVGANYGDISASYAAISGSVAGSSYNVGGLVGSNSGTGTISNSYATGNVSGGSYSIGGLVGSNSGTISNSYATGSASGSGNVGGLVGYSSGTITNSFWDKQTSGMATGVGNAPSYDSLGKTTAEMRNLSTFSGTWDIDDAGSTGTVWRIYDGDTYPLLRSSLTPITVNGVNSKDKTYNGLAYSGGNGYSITGADPALVSYGGTAQGAINAGSYTISLYSGQQGYDLTGTRTATLTVNKAPLAVTAADDSKTYSGQAYSGGNGVAYSGFVNSETNAVLGGTPAYDGTSQGATNAGSYTITPSGLTSGNYTIAFADGTLTVNKAPLTITAATNTKTYDGTATAAALPTLSGLQTGDTVTGLTEVYANQDAGTGKTLNVSGYTVNDGNSGQNYTITTVNNTNGVINTAPLTITASNDSKTYSGQAYSGGNGVNYTGFVHNETNAVLGGTLAYGGTSQGAINAGSYIITPSGLTSGNYTITFDDGTLTITSAPTPIPTTPPPPATTPNSGTIVTTSQPPQMNNNQTFTPPPAGMAVNTGTGPTSLLGGLLTLTPDLASGGFSSSGFGSGGSGGFGGGSSAGSGGIPVSGSGSGSGFSSGGNTGSGGPGSDTGTNTTGGN